MKRLIWSYGGGIQTIAILTLVAEGKLPTPELAIFADTGRERSSTWEYLEEVAGPLMERLGIRFEVASHDLATVDLYAHNGDLLMPAYTTDGKLPTFCSQEWKRQVCLRRLRQLGYGPKKPVVTWYGMSLDEIHRMSDSRLQWHSHHYPLILDVPLRRIECETQIERFGLPLPRKSACWMCPHMNDAEWQEVRAHPTDWAKAVALDEEIRANDEHGGVWLHKSRVPLAQAEFADKEELPLFECADSCWT
jgi:hypothetical protein